MINILTEVEIILCFALLLHFLIFFTVLSWCFLHVSFGLEFGTPFIIFILASSIRGNWRFGIDESSSFYEEIGNVLYVHNLFYFILFFYKRKCTHYSLFCWECAHYSYIVSERLCASEMYIIYLFFWLEGLIALLVFILRLSTFCLFIKNGSVNQWPKVFLDCHQKFVI